MKLHFLKRLLPVAFALAVLLVGVMFLGISVGSTGNNFGDVWRSLLVNKSADSVLEAIIWKIRLPRVMLAVLVGATLSLGGLVFQALLRNPLAEPYILGISGG